MQKLKNWLSGLLIALILLGAQWACKDAADEEQRTDASVAALGVEYLEQSEVSKEFSLGQIRK